MPVILGVRSSIFLPFQNLKTIIIDEEHDASFKQNDPAPRYHGRDAAIYLGTLLQAKILLGTATPAVETYHHANSGKYGLVRLLKRYGDVKLPDISFADLRRDFLSKKSQFSNTLINAMQEALAHQRQVIIFKNRRGFAPVVRCGFCGWQAGCPNCDISLTFHKYRDNMHCHYCGYQTYVPRQCPACGSPDVRKEGYGTQKLEEELAIIFPEARIKRMDFDTTRSKFSHLKIINDFEDQLIDILVGTQMVTKGLDFDHVGLVGVINADQSLHRPHYKAHERTFQLLTQVAGRAGRKELLGKVIIQSYQPAHPVFADVALNDYLSFYNREIEERQKFKYPPYYRLIRLQLKHKKRDIVQQAAIDLANNLKYRLGKRVIGPAEPVVARLRNQYLMDIGIKLEMNYAMIKKVKELLKENVQLIHQKKGMTTVRVNIDVDPEG